MCLGRLARSTIEGAKVTREAIALLEFINFPFVEEEEEEEKTSAEQQQQQQQQQQQHLTGYGSASKKQARWRAAK